MSSLGDESFWDVVGSQGFHQSVGHCLSRVGSLALIPIGSVLGKSAVVSSMGLISLTDAVGFSSHPSFSELLKDCSSSSALTCPKPLFRLAVILRFGSFLIGKWPSSKLAFKNWEGDAWEQWQSYVQSQFAEWAFYI